MARILCIDDDNDRRAGLCALLTFEGHSVVQATDVADALAGGHFERPLSLIVVQGKRGSAGLANLGSHPGACKVPLLAAPDPTRGANVVSAVRRMFKRCG